MNGIAHKFGDNINTDYIISGRYKFSITDKKELAKHIFEDIAPGFANKVSRGDFIVAGRNFGCGSSREQAPLVIKTVGISAVLARSFARIFYRNGFNLGLALIECETDRIKDGDMISVDLKNSILKNVTRGTAIQFKPIPVFMQRILKYGGLLNYFKKYGGFEL